MITFDSLTLKAFTEENRNFFEDARIQKVQQPTRQEIILVLRKNTDTKRFYININPQAFHICFMSKENEELRLIKIPQKPPMFCMQLRKYLENAKIVRINQPNYERIFEIYIETYNELQEKIELCFAVELMGKYSNAILYNADTNMIIGCAHNVGSAKSSVREVFGGLPYVYPPKQKKKDILKEFEICESLENFYWFSSKFAQLCKGKSIEQLKDYVNLKNISPAITPDFKEFSLFSELLPSSITFKSVNEMIDCYFAKNMMSQYVNSLKSELINHTKNQIQKLDKQCELLNKISDSDKDYDDYKLNGDLIMANLYNLKDYTKEITVFDYKNNSNRTIKLDENLSLKENAQKFYKKYSKIKKRFEKNSEILQNYNQKKENLIDILYFIDNAENHNDLNEIKSEIISSTNDNKLLKEKINIDEREIKGFKVYIGKNNKQNDYIVSKLAKENDYWFHVKNTTGSHVLLKCATPDDNLILECAKLAKNFSSAKNSTKSGVIYTKAKYLKKPPNTNLGYVIYKNEREIVVSS